MARLFSMLAACDARALRRVCVLSAFTSKSGCSLVAGHPAAQLSAPMIWLLGLLIAFVTRKGGLIEPDDWEAKKDAKTAPPPATA